MVTTVTKEDLWCCYCRGQEFIEVPDPDFPDDSYCSSWECTICGAQFQHYSEIGWRVTDWGKFNGPDDIPLFNPNSGNKAFD